MRMQGLEDLMNAISEYVEAAVDFHTSPRPARDYDSDLDIPTWREKATTGLAEAIEKFAEECAK